MLQTRVALARHRDYLELLHAVAEAANESSDLHQILAEVLAMTCESLGWPLGHAMTVVAGEPSVGRDDPWYLADPRRFARLRAATEALDGLGLIGEAIADGEPKAYTQVADHPEFRRAELVGELGLAHLLCAPIRSGTRVVAVLEFLAPSIANHKLESLLMLLDSISKTVGRVAEREDNRRQRHELLRAELSREQAELQAAELAALAAALRRRNAELDQFAYVASHDLRAPLRGIANLASWLAKDLEPHLTDDTRRYLALLHSRVTRMEGLINGLLEFSRVGRKQVPAEDVDVAGLVGEIVDLLGTPREVEWVLTGLPRLRCQRLLLRQVLQNLMSNAIKYAEAERLRVEIAGEPATLAGDRPGWRFRVRDNGQGIDPRYHERVWQIFQTLQPRDRVEGTGIGLALVRKIVEQSGGAVALESRPGCGASFSFTWPARTPDGADPQPSAGSRR